MPWLVLTGNTTPVAFLFLSPKKQVNTGSRQVIILHALSASGVQQHAPGGTGMVLEYNTTTLFEKGGTSGGEWILSYR